MLLDSRLTGCQEEGRKEGSRYHPDAKLLVEDEKSLARRRPDSLSLSLFYHHTSNRWNQSGTTRNRRINCVHVPGNCVYFIISISNNFHSFLPNKLLLPLRRFDDDEKAVYQQTALQSDRLLDGHQLKLRPEGQANKQPDLYSTFL